jgi:hypothetical protein
MAGEKRSFQGSGSHHASSLFPGALLKAWFPDGGVAGKPVSSSAGAAHRAGENKLASNDAEKTDDKAAAAEAASEMQGIWGNHFGGLGIELVRRCA